MSTLIRWASLLALGLVVVAAPPSVWWAFEDRGPAHSLLVAALHFWSAVHLYYEAMK